MSKKKKAHIIEEDLYAPIRDYLEECGFLVKGEVEHCDVTAMKDDVILVVEMKLSLNLDVILQAVLRQRVADIVYIAVPKKGKLLFTKRWQNICHLLRRLEIGLLLVSLRGEHSFVELALEAKPFDRQRSRAVSGSKRVSLIKEFESRSGDLNNGGSTRKRIITAYRESAIHIASLLRKHGSLSIKQLKEMGTDEKKTAPILRDNHYGWFDRVSRGVYTINEKGSKELQEYGGLVEFYSELVAY